MALKDRLSRIREHLDPEEQTLLTLRVDRGFSFGAIAEVMSETGSIGCSATCRPIADVRHREPAPR